MGSCGSDRTAAGGSMTRCCGPRRTRGRDSDDSASGISGDGRFQIDESGNDSGYPEEAPQTGADDDDDVLEELPQARANDDDPEESPQIPIVPQGPHGSRTWLAAASAGCHSKMCNPSPFSQPTPHFLPAAVFS
eukprot:5473945-Pyramimonas_sp.AAC.2